MRVWTNNKFQGMWPVPTAAVVIAETKERAEILLRRELKKWNLPQPDESGLEVKEVLLDEEGVVILQNGDY